MTVPNRRRARGGGRAAAQKRFYAAHGYLVIPDLLTARELARLRAALATLLRSARRLRRSNDKFMIVRGLDNAHHVSRIRNPIAHHRRFHELVFHRRILDVVSWLRGPDGPPAPADGKLLGHWLTLGVACAIGLVVFLWKRPTADAGER